MWRICGAIASIVALLLLPSAAQAITYAPVDQPGPPLDVPQSKLDASMECKGNLAAATEPVLLVPGTTVNPHADFSWNWEPALDKLGIPWCSVELPGNSMGDIQVAGEYVVNAIRTMYARAGRRIAVIGHSQGGMVPRWALRFWPDTRAMVEDQIGFAPSNHGTIDADVICLVGGCAPAIWQQRDTSEFTKALNSHQETFPGISYTEVYTHLDEVVVPNLNDSGSSSLHGGGGEITNVAVQDLCPLDLNEHLLVGTIDPVAYALAIDAMQHPGPADPSRISPGVCTQLLMPGVNPLTFATDIAGAALVLTTTLATYPHVAAEPSLACYVTASCPAAELAPAAGATAGAEGRSHARKCRKRRAKHAAASKRRKCVKKKRPG